MNVRQSGRRRRVVRTAGPVIDVVTIEQLGAVSVALRPSLVARAAATLGDWGAAEDVVQEVLLDAAEAVAHGETLCDAGRRLLHGTNAKAHQRSRQAQRRQFVQLDAAAASRVAEPDLLAEAAVFVEKARARVSATQWRVLTRKACGWSVHAIAQDLGRGEQAVKSALQRTRTSLRHLHDAWRAVLVLPLGRRLEAALRRGQAAAGELAAPAQGLALVVALGVVAMPGSSSPASAATAGDHRAPTHLPAVVSDGVAEARPEHQAMATPVRGAGGVSATSSGSPSSGTARAALLLVGASGESPEDTHFVDAAASPDYPKDHTIVSLGVGQACACPTLFRSTDGGASWEASTAALPYGSHVVLPPGFSGSDPRIFVTNAPSGDVPDFVAPRFGAPFLPLPMPPGDLAVSMDSSGATRVFVAGLRHVWRYDIGPPSATLPAAPPTPVLDYLESPAVATLSAPAGSTDVFVMSPAGSTPSSSVLTTPTTDVGLFRCNSAATCALVTLRPAPFPEALVASPRFASDHTLVAIRNDHAALSTDSGHSFTELTSPGGASLLGAATLALTPSGLELWLGVTRSAGGYALLHAPLGATTWIDASTHPTLRTSPAGALLAVGRTILDVVSGHGLLCTTSNGFAWSPRCVSTTP